MSLMQNIWNMWENMTIDADKSDLALQTAKFILANKSTYEQVGGAFGVPFYVIGAIHYRESSFDFTTHLANGDPLFDSDGTPIATTHVPSGLGPFASWVAGAIGAIKEMSWGEGWHWDICNALDNAERWNGLGLRRMGLPSPYVWAATSNYKSGMYVADGVFNPNKVDERVGAAAIWKSISTLGVDLNEVKPV